MGKGNIFYDPTEISHLWRTTSPVIFNPVLHIINIDKIVEYKNMIMMKLSNKLLGTSKFKCTRLLPYVWDSVQTLHSTPMIQEFWKLFDFKQS